ncbi:hypothetical protein BLNAU_13713 [Blattamonas nauphoetae]|uniref:Uncharacterized protein n=1 Tax=Blattamonas nauphoetae TaxID=2049346 RepID=A0ABQ9XI00_9EUKA|nr:hypothetical protein BLNAU_20503 [Blattamonas nauphoetae]KAK2944927.1 hypothetical protein BLNAU_20170 [Blattamonas nauphoetae]KAK2949863.1 hypothetical protein BLNAU_15166 [Blattamonas nauphoetae]KAK2951334.1 hypothetical protein BLNAU_13713 [Blattamonas nauphoetae]
MKKKEYAYLPLAMINNLHKLPYLFIPYLTELSKSANESEVFVESKSRDDEITDTDKDGCDMKIRLAVAFGDEQDVNVSHEWVNVIVIPSMRDTSRTPDRAETDEWQETKDVSERVTDWMGWMVDERIDGDVDEVNDVKEQDVIVSELAAWRVIRK